MGWSLSWLAVKGKPPQSVRDELGFRPTGQRREFPESDLCAAEMPNGWYLIVSDHDEQVVSDEAMQRLSAAGVELVTCFVEEHVMCSSATGWQDGQKRWSVIHDCQKSRGNLQTEGELPAAFNPILARLKARQQEADAKKESVDFIFDVPVEIAQSLTGYRHDRDIPGLSGDVFEVLETPAKSPATEPPANLGAKWMNLKGWQRGVFGTLVILGFLALILFGVAFVFTYVVK